MFDKGPISAATDNLSEGVLGPLSMFSFMAAPFTLGLKLAFSPETQSRDLSEATFGAASNAVMKEFLHGLSTTFLGSTGS